MSSALKETMTTWTFPPTSKLCFVTTGATAPFPSLITSILSPPSLSALLSHGYTHLLIQYGSAETIYTQALTPAQAHVRNTLTIDGIAFNPDGLHSQLTLVQKSNGIVVSHAGSGSILAVLRYGLPLVVVPNTGLADNHQEELADAMQRSGYLIKGDVGDLAASIHAAEEFRTKMAQFPPITSGKHRETKSFADVMDETVGFLD